MPPPRCPFLTQQGSDKETTISSRRRPGRMEGPRPWTSPSSHTSWCQTHFISSRLGARGLPLQDYFLLRLVFQLETLGAPRQGGGSSALALEASKGPEWNASWGECLPSEEGPKVWGSGWGPPLTFKSPSPLAEGLCLWAESDFRGQEWGTPCHPPPPGAQRRAGNAPPMMD